MGTTGATGTTGSAGGRLVRAAGAVLWRGDPRTPDRIEVALVHRPRYDDWSMPKGKLKPGEHVLTAAVREVAEETGHTVTLGRPLPRQRYALPDGNVKQVRFWAARVEAAASAATFTPNEEVDRLAWLSLPAARARLSYARDVLLLDSLLDGPLDTVPLVLLRHARAVKRRRWREAGHADDGPRPLTARGQAQARGIVEPLRALGPLALVSSDAERCRQTLAPYLAATGASCALELAFSEAGAAADPELARARVAAVADAARPTLICTHRPVLPTLMETLCQRSGFPTPTGMLAFAAFWVAHAWSGRIRAAYRVAGPPEM